MARPRIMKCHAVALGNRVYQLRRHIWPKKEFLGKLANQIYDTLWWPMTSGRKIGPDTLLALPKTHHHIVLADPPGPANSTEYDWLYHRFSGSRSNRSFKQSGRSSESLRSNQL